MATRLVYVGDPMCSWCWGFAPVAAHLNERFDVDLDVVMGGLRPGPNAQPLDDRLAGFLRNEWSKIESVTGQPFSFDALDRKEWIYDTEVPAAAVVLARDSGVADPLAFMAVVQEAFYAKGIDVTRPEVYADLWTHESETGVSPDEFVQRLNHSDSRRAAYADFDQARQLGVQGFPALLFERDGSPPVRRMVTYGYQPADHLVPVLEHLLAEDDEPHNQAES